MQAKILAQEYGFNYDRSLGVPIELPYTYDDIAIPINEIATHSTINEIYIKLQANLVYLYSLTKLSDNNIPVNYAKIASGTPSLLFSTSGAFAWIPTSLVNSNQSRALSAYGLLELDNLNDGKFSATTLGKSRIGFFVSDSYISALTSNYDLNTIGVYVSTNKVTESSKFTFSKLTSIAYDENNYIYVTDSGNDSVYKYDISNLILEDNIIGKKILYVDSMGGTGTFENKDKFNFPSYINIFNNLIYLIDKNNYCIKVFDSNLNWRQTYRRKQIFENNTVTAFRPNSKNNLFYFGFEDKLLITTPDILPPPTPDPLIKYYNQTMSTQSKYNAGDFTFYSLSSYFVAGEKIVDFNFSEIDDNIFYIITNKNIYKRFISKPNTYMGQFLLDRFNINFTSLRFSFLEKYDEDTDNLIIYGKNNNTGIFFSFLEDSNYQTILTNNDLDFYSIDEIKINPEEYSQDWVFSKANYKILLNILSMRDRLVKRFAGKYDSYGNLLFFGTLYLLDNEVQKEQFDYSLNYFVGVNEMFSNSVINRSVKKFYSLQTQMLSVLRDTAINVWPPISAYKLVS